MLNALIQRELMSLFRQRRLMVFQIGLATLFCLLVVIRWPTDGRIALSGVRSQQVFQLFGYGLLATFLLVLPSVPATSVVREKKSGTLELLLNTPLGPLRIFAGKLISVLVLAGIMLAMSFPAAGACYSMGGLSLYDNLGKVYFLLAIVALQYATLGLLVSCYCQSVDAAIRLTYGIVIGLSVLSIVPHFFFQGTGGILASMAKLVRALSPLATLMSLTGAGNVGGQGIVEKANLLSQYATGAITISVVASLMTIGRLNHKIFDQARSAGTISDDLSLTARILRRLFFLVDPQKRSRGISSFVNPVLVKEFRCRRFGRLHWLLRLVAVCAIMSLGLTCATTAGTFDWGPQTIGGIMVVLQIVLIVLIAPSLSANLISAELESGGWQLLRTTPLSVASILCGKLLSVILPLMLILCATLPGYLVMVYIEPGMELQIKRVLVCLISTAVFPMLVSAAVGSFFSRTATATASAYGVMLAIIVLPVLVWLGRDSPFGHATVEAALSFSSVAAALSVIQMPGFQHYELIPINWWIMGVGSVLSLLVLVVQAYRISRPQ